MMDCILGFIIMWVIIGLLIWFFGGLILDDFEESVFPGVIVGFVISLFFLLIFDMTSKDEVKDSSNPKIFPKEVRENVPSKPKEVELVGMELVLTFDDEGKIDKVRLIDKGVSEEILPELKDTAIEAVDDPYWETENE
ncbi:MAG: hypothetical protein GY870_14125 [archaeon]|nr:hypothetical protein [archaeon]